MPYEVMRYIRSNNWKNFAFVEKVGKELVRNGIFDMVSLCSILEREPEKLLDMRNIGKKSFVTIESICSTYLREIKENKF